MTPSCFCLRHCVLYCPVERIPLSRDEQQACMREAQYHSAVLQPTSTAAPTQLDPGSLLLDSSLRKNRGGPSDAQLRTGGANRGNGANTLLKQAIANRIKTEQLEKRELLAPEKDSEMEMSRSIVGNPAWYRDDEGRTGFKPREWENLPNEQKDQVKKRKEKRKEADLPVEEIDSELLRSKERAEHPKLERKLSKEEKKELKKKEKEEKKREKDEKKRLEKEEKERRKSLTSLEKEEKKRRKEREKSQEEGLQEGTMENVEKRERTEAEKIRKKEKEERKRREKEDNKQIMDEKGEKSESGLSPEQNPSSRKQSDVSVTSSSKSTDTVKRHPGKPPRHPSLDSKLTPPTLPSSPSSSNEEEKAPRITVAVQKHPRRTTIGERRDSSMSESSRISGVSHKSVTFSDRVETHEIERFELSSSEDDDVAVMSDDELSKPDSERRRRLVRLLQEQEEIPTDSDEDFEEQERLIEEKLREEEFLRQNALYPVYNLEETQSQDSFYAEDHDPDRFLLEEEDGSYISLDKLPAAVRRAIITDMRGRSQEDEPRMGSMSKLHEEPVPQGYVLPRSASGYLDDNYMVQSYQQAMYGAYQPHHEQLSPRSYRKVAENQISERRSDLQQFSPTFERNSDVQQHFPRNQDPIQQGALLPRRFASVESAELRKTPSSSQEPTVTLPPTSPEFTRNPRTLGERRELKQLHESFYDNVPGRSTSLLGTPIGLRPPERSANSTLPPKFEENQAFKSLSPIIGESSVPRSLPPRYDEPQAPRRGSSTSIERRAFFESMNPSIGTVYKKEQEENSPTPSPPRIINPQQRVLITTTTTSASILNRTEILEKKERSEEEMRSKFVKQFGARKAPKAEEEDPLDPGPTNYGSKESIYSTDSRESVVSETSIRKESLIRRNFNY